MKDAAIGPQRSIEIAFRFPVRETVHRLTRLTEQAWHRAIIGLDALAYGLIVTPAADLEEEFCQEAIVNRRYGDGWTPLHLAAAFPGAHRHIPHLLSAGADANAQLDDGSTPLHLAAGAAWQRCWHPSVLADTRLDGEDAVAPSVNARLELFFLLTVTGFVRTHSYGLGGSRFPLTLCYPATAIRQRVLAAFISLQALDHETDGDIARAAKTIHAGENVSAVRCLLENGADTQIRDRHGRRALDLARAEGHERIVTQLTLVARLPAMK